MYATKPEIQNDLPLITEIKFTSYLINKTNGHIPEYLTCSFWNTLTGLYCKGYLYMWQTFSSYWDKSDQEETVRTLLIQHLLLIILFYELYHMW